MINYFLRHCYSLFISHHSPQEYDQTVQSITAGQYVSEDKLIVLCELCDGTQDQLFVEALQSHLNPMINDPVVAQLTLKSTQHKGKVSLEQLFFEADEQKTPEVNTQYIHL